jgi:hypothetical protein
VPGAKAPIVQEPAVEAEAFDASGLDELSRQLDALPQTFDSILQLWTLSSSTLPLASLALFLPHDELLLPAAHRGFPLGGKEGLPLSLADSLPKPGASLEPEAAARCAAILGSPAVPSLRAAVMWPETGLSGMWLYQDSRLETASPDVQSRLGELLAHAADRLPAVALPLPAANPAGILLEAAWKYPSASVFSFDLSSFFAQSPGAGRSSSLSPGIGLEALRASFLGACSRILSQGGLALAYEKGSVGCILGSGSTADPDLALFQFKKTLKRILPFLSAAPFPEGRALRLDPSAETALEELSRFLFE